ncbi:hypothetical protein NG42_02290 [Winslowiella iniecta]|uniref:HTH araC/xylS-type domain-containing protein n=2 Tax=Winslowiella iniecta TaxID=1560201 RepID=A0A0L7TB58_9GAMM|nr:hypothetical protein NG43_18130 [Winslowiella iniecta]KOC92598.1 hypothetical protein NG42_02290 [Winslowiella iniecta]
MLIPFNFVLSFCFMLLLLRMLLRDGNSRWFSALLTLCLVHYLFAGLKQLYPLLFISSLLPVTATALPLLCWLALRQASGQRAPLSGLLIPVGMMVWCVWLWPQGIDGLLLVSWLACGGAMLFRLRAGEAIFSAPLLRRIGITLLSWRLMAVMLIFTALLDLAITTAISFSGDIVVRSLLFAGQIILCLFIAMALVLTPVGASTAPDISVRTADESDAQVLQTVEQVMRDTALYRDSGLNLAMLARKSGIPARKVSAAINLLRQQSVSQYVNQWRISEACQQLRQGSRPVIDIMEAVGFVTKSNFNREFLRITGQTPSQWRSGHSDQAGLS